MMKFLSDEWFDALTENIYKLFDKPSKLTFKFCEVFQNCPGEHSLVWVVYDIDHGIAKGVTHGVDVIPPNDYLAIGNYADHIRVCKKEINPKKSVIDGTFTVDSHNEKVGAMRLLGLIEMYMRLVEAKQLDGVDYD